ncbi:MULTISPECIES: 1,4-dihydroxy-2-naphthoate octaprenyltransferase [Flavobacterium]|jgi:1,4-dihydroxy-2-naphthoate octaprenyltransferase|uniref:1,4-dihydroxy-2-naphthoate octaprenyltransferase n=1 Tax=Flavobacterium TaxID=237 RepID=UPI000700FE1E|nr:MULTISPECIES: 1,4-dihydroxy-2-naphthoate octaprenyltransferase [Flavobacterium]MBU7570206.1 1,4-dihydroxy-2-naphthoate octaprenyltransferase [Flavobacterium sp.]PZO26720.1 MAG: 1,4-dihydroxy-2-naphthoate octaprenyltransferase [Flavobacteriaceae bacterium]PZQ92312.1 MAG: 1,4-dihydroxy-2-naphthoate octaprenyltransferase [Flavobacterium johnsoniae]KQS53461.1 1,4-dihydroxy-2-naphthoate octaprenyltransferase [Flavobacterium sp. Leaf359]MBL7869358.1 1,4-dihydroxy-2-naphthoate octaprenyltransferas
MKHWVEAARLRTLPLSVSGIIVGSMYALAYPTANVLTPTEVFNWQLFGFAILTTLGLQVLSNFANDYGDGIKGTDNEDRIGPKRAIQSGVISPQAMKRAIIITSVLTFISAVLLIYFAFGETNIGYSIFFLVLGLLAIASAIRYTVGNTAYGYRGYGDLFVFVFFGLVSTLGVNFLYSKELDYKLFLPAIAIGFLSVGVLNLNNMRDEESDRKSGKNTIVVKIGGAKAKKYHYFLVISAMILVLVFAVLNNFQFDQYIFVVAYFPLISHLITVYKNKDPKKLDPELKKLAISTFLLSVLLSLCLIFFLSDIIVNN